MARVASFSSPPTSSAARVASFSSPTSPAALAAAEAAESFSAPAVAVASAAAYAASSALAWTLHDRLRQVRLYAVLAAAIGIGCAVAAANQIFWTCYNPDAGQDPNCFGRSMLTDALKAGATVSTAVLLVLIVVRTYLEFGELKERGQLTEHETFFNSPQMLPMLTELVVCAAHCPVGVYYNTTFRARGIAYLYDLDSLMSVWMLLRLYLVVQLLRDAAGFGGLIARVIGRFNNVRLDSTFAFRSILREYPLGVVVFFFGLTMVVEGYALHVFERPVCATDFAITAFWCGDASMGLKDYSDLSVSIWNAVITSLTVGFGDVFPVTHPGRIVCVASGIVGAITTALLINGVAEFSKLPPDGERVQKAIRLAELERERVRAAAAVVRAFMAHCAHRRRPTYIAAAAAREGSAAVAASKAPATAAAGEGPDTVPPSLVANRLIRAVLGGAYSGRAPASVTRKLTSTVIQWRLFLAHYWRRTHNFDTAQLIYRELLLLSEKVSLLGAQAGAERRYMERRRAEDRDAERRSHDGRARSVGKGDPAASSFTGTTEVADTDSDAGHGDEQWPTVDECRAMHLRQLRLLEKQRELDEPKPLAYRASKSRQDMSRMRRAQSMRIAATAGR